MALTFFVPPGQTRYACHKAHQLLLIPLYNRNLRSYSLTAPSGITTNTAYPDGVLSVCQLNNPSPHFQGNLFAITLSYPA